MKKISLMSVSRLYISAEQIYHSLFINLIDVLKTTNDKLRLLLTTFTIGSKLQQSQRSSNVFKDYIKKGEKVVFLPDACYFATCRSKDVTVPYFL